MAQSQRRLRCGGTSRARPDRDPVAHPARVSARADRGRPSDQSDRVIALHLLDLLDEDGYLRAGLDEVTRLLGCGKGLEPATHSLGLKVVSRQMFHRHPVVNRPASGTTGASMGGKGIKCG